MKKLISISLALAMVLTLFTGLMVSAETTAITLVEQLNPVDNQANYKETGSNDPWHPMTVTYENGLANYTSSSAYPNGYISGSTAGEGHYAGAYLDGLSISTAGATGLVFYMETQNVGTIGFQIQSGRMKNISLYDVNAENAKWAGVSSYTDYEDWREWCVIPAGFEGYVYVPFAGNTGDWSTVAETITLIQLWLGQVGGDYGTFSLGNIYTTADTVVNGNTASVVLPVTESIINLTEQLTLADNQANYKETGSNDPWHPMTVTYENGLANYTSSSAYPNGYISGSTAGEGHYAGAYLDGLSISTAGATGLVFYMETQNVGTIGFQIQSGRMKNISLYDVNAENAKWVGVSSYTDYEDWREWCVIPAGFEGYVYVPFAGNTGDWSTVAETITLIQLWLGQVGGEYGTFSLGNIYTTADTVVNGTTAGVILPEKVTESILNLTEQLTLVDNQANYKESACNDPWHPLSVSYADGLANYTSNGNYPNGYLSGVTAGEGHYAGAYLDNLSIATAGATGLVFYVKTQNVGTIGFQIQGGRMKNISLYDVNAENAKWVGVSSYTDYEDWREWCVIPAGFEGYVYVPFAGNTGDWSTVAETITLIQLWLGQVGGEYGTFSLGNIYTTSDTVVNGTTAGVVLPVVENPTATFEMLKMQDVANYGNFISSEPWDTTATSKVSLNGKTLIKSESPSGNAYCSYEQGHWVGINKMFANTVSGTDYAGLAVYVKTEAANKLAFATTVHAGSVKLYDVNAEAGEWTVAATTTQDYTNWRTWIDIPANFEGWVYVSLEGVTDAQNLLIGYYGIGGNYGNIYTSFNVYGVDIEPKADSDFVVSKDCNDDLAIDVIDLVRLKKTVANKDYIVAGDLDNNGENDAADLTEMRRYLLEK